jgi:transposase
MPQNFLTCDRDQALLLPPDLRDWLPEDHLAWFVIEAVDELDLETFYCAYCADGHGAAAHEPKMMLTLLAYAYCVGERSSRGIERRCREDVAFRVICANQVPDHATIARFRVRHEDALADLFGQVLGLCAEAGLVKTGVVAVDGSKFRAAASDSAIRTYEDIAREILAEAGRIDEAEDERYGEARGDELPERLTTRDGRRAWLREAKERLDRERAANPEPVPRDREKRLRACHQRLVEAGAPSSERTAPTRPGGRAGSPPTARGVWRPARPSPISHPSSPRARSTPPTPTPRG